MAALIAGTSFVVVAIASQRLLRAWINPLTVFFGVWFASIALYEVRVEPIVSVSLRAWTAVSLAMAGFALGGLSTGAALRLAQGYPHTEFQPRLGMRCPDALVQLSHAVSVAAVVIGGLALYYVIATRGLQALLYEGNKIRATYFVGDREGLAGSTYVLSLLYAAGALAGATYSGAHRRVVDTVWLLLPVVGAILHDLAYLGRAPTIQVVLLVLFGVLLRGSGSVRQLVNAPGMKVVAVSVLAALVTVSYLRGLPTLANVYRYLSGNIAALSVFLDRVERPYTFGVSTFYPFVRILYRTGLLPLADPPVVSYVDDYVRVPFVLNTYTFIRPFHEDLGLVGDLLIPYLYGIVAVYVFVKGAWYGNLTALVLSSFVLTALVFSIQGHSFGAFPYFYGAILAAGTSKITCTMLRTRRVSRLPSMTDRSLSN